MSFANDEFCENQQSAIYTLFQAKIKFSYISYTFSFDSENFGVGVFVGYFPYYTKEDRVMVVSSGMYLPYLKKS
jgi:hypothetical protein